METAESTSNAVRVFISSPGDVRPERLIAQRLIEKLGKEFSHHLTIEAVLWEREPLLATEDFQTAIPPSHDSDIVVVILRSKLGTLLPADKFTGAISGRQVTGTEWEFEDAFAAYRKNAKPDMLVYRNKTPVMVSLDDDAELEQRRQQKQALEDFIRRWFIDADNNTYKLAFREFESTTEFEDMLETHLRTLLEKKLANGPTERVYAWHDGSPFRGLQSFELEHASVFFGRSRACHELRELLARQIAGGCAFILVFGASGSGKSSLVKAGLLAALKLPGMIGKVAMCRHAIFRPAESPTNLFDGLANALLSQQALPELAELQYDRANLSQLLRQAPQQAGLPIQQGLNAVAKAEKDKLTERAEIRLVLIVDQLEELFTINGLTPNDRSAFVAVLESLATSGFVWVISTMRSDFFDHLEQLPVLTRLTAGEARYLLTPPDETEIGQIVRQPAREAGLYFEKDIIDGRGLDDELCKAATLAPSVLPLLEFTLDQLWQRRTEHGKLTFEAYRALGGLEGALGKRAEEVFSLLPAHVQAALPQVLRALATIDAGVDFKITARMVSFAVLASEDAARLLVEAFLAPEARLLVADGNDDIALVRVAHEALLTHWERARKQLINDRFDLQLRSRLEQSAALWKSASAADRDDRLLHAGLPLLEAEGLLNRRHNELDKVVVAYIEASSHAVQEALRKAKRRVQITLAVFGVLTVLALITASVAYQQKQAADQQRQIAMAGQLAAQATLFGENAPNGDVVETAAALALESWRRLHNTQAAAAANKLVQMLPVHRIQHHGIVFGVAVSRDDKWLATASTDKTARLIVAATGKEQAQFRHEGMVTSVAFSPDGRYLATASADKTAKLIDIAGGKEISRVNHDNTVQRVAFSTDSRLLATASLDRTVRLTDTATGQEKIHFPHDDEVWSIAFSPNGRFLATGSKDGQARLIDLARNQEIARIKHGALVANLVFSADNRWLATASADGTARLIDTSSGKPARQIQHAGKVWSVAFSPDNKLLATGSEDKTAIISEVASGNEMARIKHDDEVFAVAFSPDGRLLATATTGTIARLIETGNWREQAKLMHGDSVWSIAFNADGSRLATASSDQAARMFDTRKIHKQLQVIHDGPVSSLAFNADSRLLATAGADNIARILDMASGNEVARISHDDRVYSTLFSPDKRLLATSAKDNSARLIDTANWQEISRISHEGEVRSIAFSPDNRWLATGSLDKTVRIIDAANGKELRWVINTDEVWFIVFSFDSKTVAIACKDGVVQLLDVATGNMVRISKYQAPVTRIAFSPDGNVLAIAGQDKTARLVDIGSREELGLFKHGGEVWSVAFSPDGLWFATASNDHKARLFETESGELKALIKHGGAVTSVTFSPSGKFLATASQDNTARVIEVDTGHEIERIDHEQEVSAVVFSHDGKLLVTGSGDGKVTIGEADPQSVFDLLCAKAGRNLSREQWRDFIGDNQSPQQTCSNWRDDAANE